MILAPIQRVTRITKQPPWESPPDSAKRENALVPGRVLASKLDRETHNQQHERADLALFLDCKYAATPMTVAAKQERPPDGLYKPQARASGKAPAVRHSRKFENLDLRARQAAT